MPMILELSLLKVAQPRLDPICVFSEFVLLLDFHRSKNEINQLVALVLGRIKKALNYTFLSFLLFLDLLFFLEESSSIEISI